ALLPSAARGSGLPRLGQSPRLQLANDSVAIPAEPLLPPCKVGYLNRGGWVAYLNHGVLFVKRFFPRPDERHADFGCNAEFYCNDQFLEMESLAPLARLEPGQSVEHVETWELYPGLDAPPTLDGVRTAIEKLGLR